jgi:hypothetical protein
MLSPSRHAERSGDNEGTAARPADRYRGFRLTLSELPLSRRSPTGDAAELSISGVSTGVTASLSSTAIGASASSVLTLSASKTATRGTFSIVVTGASQGVTRTTTLALQVRRA